MPFSGLRFCLPFKCFIEIVWLYVNKSLLDKPFATGGHGEMNIH